jgi:hypothetical protein
MPPVLQTAALGGSGPGVAGHELSLVHWAPVMLHVPTAGQLRRSTPGSVQGWLVSAQTPPVGGHWLSLAHAAPLVLHLPAFGQSPLLKHPIVVPSVQTPPPQPVGLVQTEPSLRQAASEPHTLFFLGPEALLHVPLTDGHDPLAVHDLALHKRPAAGQSWSLVHTVVPFWQVFVEQRPPVMGQSLADAHAVEPLLHRPVLAAHVATVWHMANGELLQLPGQS